MIPTAEEALVVTELAPVLRELARPGLVVRALPLLFILTEGEDTSDTWIDTALAGTPTTTILALTSVLTPVTLSPYAPNLEPSFFLNPH